MGKISQFWLHLDFEEIQDLGLIGIGLTDNPTGNSSDGDRLTTDTFEAFDHIFNRPEAFRLLSISLKERLKTFLQMPLQVVGQHTKKNVGADAIIELVVDG